MLRGGTVSTMVPGLHRASPGEVGMLTLHATHRLDPLLSALATSVRVAAHAAG